MKNEEIVELLRKLDDPSQSVRRKARKQLCLIGKSAVPLLTEFLKNKSKPDHARQSVVFTLRDIESHEVVPVLAEVIKDKDESVSVRQSALQALGNIGSSEVLSVLIEASRDQNQSVRESAITALGSTRLSGAVPILIKIVKDKGEVKSIRQSAVSALSHLDSPQIVPILSDVLKDRSESDSLRQSVVPALRNLDASTAIPILFAILKDRSESDSLRTNTVSELRNLDAPRVIPELIKVLKDKSEVESIRQSAVSALSHLDSAQIVPILSDVLKDRSENDSLRANIVSELRNLDAPRVIPELIKVLKDKAENDSLRQEIASALGDIDFPEVVPPLLHILKDKVESESLRERVATVLSDVDSHEVVPSLVKVLKDKSEEESLRQTIASALWNIDRPEIVPLMIEMLRDKATNEYLRHIILSGLEYADYTSHVYSPEVAHEVIRIFKGIGENLTLREKAASVLNVIDYPELVVPALIEALENKNQSLRESAASALSYIGVDDWEAEYPEAITALVEVVKNDNESVRQLAAASLSQILSLGEVFSNSSPEVIDTFLLEKMGSPEAAELFVQGLEEYNITRQRSMEVIRARSQELEKFPVEIYGITEDKSEIFIDMLERAHFIIDSRWIQKYRFRFANGESVEKTKEALLGDFKEKCRDFESLQRIAMQGTENCYNIAQQIMREAWIARRYTLPQCENKVLIKHPGLGCIFVDEHINPPVDSPWIRAARLHSPTFRIDFTCFAEDLAELPYPRQGTIGLRCAIVMEPPNQVEFVMELAVDTLTRDFLFLICATINRDFWVGEMYGYEKHTKYENVGDRKDQKFTKIKRITYIPRKQISLNLPKRETEIKQRLEVDIAPYMVCGHLRQLPYGWQASSRAKQNAKEFGFDNFPDGFTFVVPYQKGKESQLQTFRSKSALQLLLGASDLSI
ncbi:HEAT repeat domain-containing protein [Candidatus Poribacteria bacterium]|nr:HEAT repeat domain-containing protein [Candidatus Poribacteria bacterium]